MTRQMLKALRTRFPSLAALAAFIAFTLLVAAAGCSTTPTGVAELAGRYELRTVDGRSLPDDRLGGAISGELILTVGGRATRTIVRATSGIPGPITQRARGTYRVRGSVITLSLVPDGAAPASRWEVNGDVAAATTIVLRYPGPADGMVEEHYVRVNGG